MGMTDIKACGLNRRHVLALMAATGASALAGGPAFAADGGILRVSVDAEPGSLDGSTGRAGRDHVILWSMFDTLIEFTPDLQPLPGLAKSWEWQDDKTLVLHLHEGISFHDGEPFNAAAVKYNLDRSVENPRSTIKADLLTVESVEVVDDYTVSIHLNTPDSALVLALSDRAGMMSSPKAMEALGDDYDRSPVGTGQMKFSRWDAASQIVTVRNDDYWKAEKSRLDGITFVIITDQNTGLRAVTSGQTNFIARIPPQLVENARSTPNLTVVVEPQLFMQTMYFNLSEGRGPMEDVRVRQAINFAMNKDAYNKVVTSELGEVAQIAFPKSYWPYDEEAASTYNYDPDRARALLKDAGFGTGLKLVANHQSDALSVQRMEIISSMLGEVGITLENVVGSAAQSNQTWDEGIGDIKLSVWTGRPDPAMTLSLLYAPTAYFNRGGAEPSKELTQVLTDARTTLDEDKRREVIARALRLERQFAMGMPLVFEPQIVVHANDVKGFVPNAMGKPKFDDMWIES